MPRRLFHGRGFHFPPIAVLDHRKPRLIVPHQRLLRGLELPLDPAFGRQIPSQQKAHPLPRTAEADGPQQKGHGLPRPHHKIDMPPPANLGGRVRRDRCQDVFQQASRLFGAVGKHDGFKGLPHPAPQIGRLRPVNLLHPACPVQLDHQIGQPVHQSGNLPGGQPLGVMPGLCASHRQFAFPGRTRPPFRKDVATAKSHVTRSAPRNR